jgi:uncharacterized membrane protein YphA (DoxX/SURF4 family)
MKKSNLLFWGVRIISALIMLQTLFYKFTGAQESVAIFTQLGMEPAGRIGSGVVELIASILLLIPSTSWLGSLLALGTMGGAIVSHLTILGIVRDDGGYLFFLAVIVFTCSAISLWLSRKSIPMAIQKYLPSFLK